MDKKRNYCVPLKNLDTTIKTHRQLLVKRRSLKLRWLFDIKRKESNAKIIVAHIDIINC